MTTSNTGEDVTMNDENEITVTLVIDLGKPLELVIKKTSQDLTVWNAMLEAQRVDPPEQRVNYSTKQYRNPGPFVVYRINGLGNARYPSWRLRINGKFVAGPFVKAKIQDGDMIEWVYWDPTWWQDLMSNIGIRIGATT